MKSGKMVSVLLSILMVTTVLISSGMIIGRAPVVQPAPIASVDLSVHGSDLSVLGENLTEGDNVTIEATVHGDSDVWDNATSSNVLFSDDFNDGTLNKWALSAWNPSGLMEVTNSVSHSPDYCAHAQSDPDTNTGPYIASGFNDTSNVLVEGWVYLPPKTQAYDKFNLLQIRTIDGGFTDISDMADYSYVISFEFIDDNYGLDLWESVKTDDGWVKNNNMNVLTLEPETWYKLGIRVIDGHYLMLVDDNVIYNGPRYDNRSVNLVVFGDTCGISGGWGDVYFDDVTVTNYSGTSARIHDAKDATCTVSFYLDNASEQNLIYREDNVFVPANGETTVSAPWSAVEGDHNIMVRVTDVNPPDSNMSNNEASMRIPVESSGYVDLSISDSDILFSGSTLVEGDNLTILATVHNEPIQLSLWIKQGVVMDYNGFDPGVQYPFVIKDDGIYKMWYTGLNLPSGSIYYATSLDGVNWTEQGIAVSVPSGLIYAVAPSVLKEPDGTYKMWFSCQDSEWKGRTYLATSTDGLNWINQGVAVDTGPSGSADAKYVVQAKVFVDSDTGVYKMYYKAYDDNNIASFMYATSDDGYSWTKQGVVMSLPSGFTNMEAPFVLKNENGTYTMWYNAASNGTSKIYVAYSVDGLNWEPSRLNLDVGASGELDDEWVSLPYVLKDTSLNEDLMYYTGSDGSNRRIFLAKMEAQSLSDATCTVSFYLDNASEQNLIYREDNVFVPANGETTVSAPWSAVEGDHSIIVRVTDVNPPDSNISNNEASKEISVTSSNMPPVADAGQNQTVYVGDTVYFNGSGSYDPDGSIVSYEWDFGDGSSGSGVNSTCIYTSEGTYTVILTVMDNDGAISTDTISVLVRPLATGANLTITKEKIEGPDVVETHTKSNWSLMITVTNDGGSEAFAVTVHDVLPAELSLSSYTVTKGTVMVSQHGNGNMGSTAICWLVGTLDSGEVATFTMIITTITNPAGHQEFTSPGNYSLNDGAWLTGVDSMSMNNISAGPTPPIMVTAIGSEGNCSSLNAGDKLDPSSAYISDSGSDTTMAIGSYLTTNSFSGFLGILLVALIGGLGLIALLRLRKGGRRGNIRL